MCIIIDAFNKYWLVSLIYLTIDICLQAIYFRLKLLRKKIVCTLNDYLVSGYFFRVNTLLYIILTQSSDMTSF